MLTIVAMLYITFPELPEEAPQEEPHFLHIKDEVIGRESRNHPLRKEETVSILLCPCPRRISSEHVMLSVWARDRLRC